MIRRLTGAFVTDYTDASGTNCLDLNRLEWSSKILKLTGIDQEKLPDIYPSTHVAGGADPVTCNPIELLFFDLFPDRLFLLLASLICPDNRRPQGLSIPEENGTWTDAL